MAPRTPAAKAKDAAYQAQPAQVRKRVARNRARREAEAAGLVHKGDGMDVDHVVPLDAGGSATRGNTRVVPASKNRAWRSAHPRIYGKKKG